MPQTELPDWRSIRTVGNSRMLKLTILVPFIGYLLIFNNNIVSYLEIYKLFDEENSLSMISRLKLTYFGLFFLGVGSAIYSLGCPRVIQQFQSEADYIEHEIKSFSKDKLRYLMSRVSKDVKSEWHSSWLARISEEHRDVIKGKSGTHTEWLRINRSKINDYLMLWYHMELKRNPSARGLVCALYLVGFGILLFPTLEIFIKIAFS